MENKAFFEVPLPTYSESNCSPSLPEDFVGVRINMPSEISLADMESIPLCGAYRVSSKLEEELEGNLIKFTVIVFINKSTDQSFSFNLVPHKTPMKSIEPPVEEIKPDEDTEIVEEYMAETYFNVDVLKFYPGFPRNKSRYMVYATNRDMKSDVVEIVITD